MFDQKIDMLPKIHNFFEIECRDINTGDIIQTAHAENIVLDHFYNSMILTNDTSKGIVHIVIGSNGDEPLKTDTNLKNIIGYGGSFTKDFSKVSIGGTGVITFNGTWVIDASSYVGQYFREVGARSSQWGNGQTINRAILKDSNGNPLEILKTDTMVVTITATLYMSIPELIGGFKYKPSRYWGYNHDSGSISFLEPFSSVVFSNARKGSSWKTDGDTIPMAEQSAGFSAEFSPDTVNKLRTFTIGTIEASSANFNGGIRAVLINGLEIPLPNASLVQPPIIKEVLGTGDGIKKEFTTKFGYIKDNGSLHVYVNDVETLDFTATFDTPPFSAKFLGFIRKPPMGGQNNVVEKITPYRVISYYLPYYDNSTLFCSNDGVVWENLGAVSPFAPTVIPTQFQNYKYWAGKHLWNEGAMSSRSDLVMSGGDIALNAPPPVGSTITVTYQPDCIAKDGTKLIKNISYKIGLDY